MHRLLRMIHTQNPYEGFNYRHFPEDLQGWGGKHPIFRELIDELSPEVILEVGSWKGQSTLNMATYIKEKNLPAKIISIDTWLGGLDHWTNFKPMLQLHNGYPTLYYQFLANVLYKDCQDIVVPFPNTSLICARYLDRAGISAEMIYIDASHDEMDVYMDLVHYVPLLKNSRSVIFGDDYTHAWPGVINAVDRFVKESGLKCSIRDSVWELRSR